MSLDKEAREDVEAILVDKFDRLLADVLERENSALRLTIKSNAAEALRAANQNGLGAIRRELERELHAMQSWLKDVDDRERKRDRVLASISTKVESLQGAQVTSAPTGLPWKEWLGFWGPIIVAIIALWQASK